MQRIIAIEQTGGEVSQSDLPALAAAAQPFQDLTDLMFYRMAGLTGEDAERLEKGLAKIL